MLGAITGDTIGSVYERNKKWQDERHVDFEPLFAKRAKFTDDTVLTVAVADSILHGADLTEKLKQYYHMYPGAGYGSGFRRWAESESMEPYNSFGNGSAMRVSPVGFAYDSLEEVLVRARMTAEVSHNHPDGIKGAQATAVAVFLARTGTNKETIRAEIEQRFGYDLSRDLDEVRTTYVFDATCPGSVPEAILAFLTSNDFEHAVRLAVSLGGDADTLACIAGGIAQAYYKEIPSNIREESISRLDEPLLEILQKFEDRFPLS